MDKNFCVPNIVDLTIDRSDSSQRRLQRSIANISHDEALTMLNVVSNPQASSSNNQISEKDNSTNQNNSVKSKRHGGYTKFRKLDDGRLRNAKIIKKTQNIVDQYAINKSTNKYFLDLYSKAKNIVSQKDK